MRKTWAARLRIWSVHIHRDLGYFFSSLIIIYSISGIALNHINDWNPDFIVQRKTIKLQQTYNRIEVSPEQVKNISTAIEEKQYQAYDFPTPDQLKIYYHQATFHLNLVTGIGEYEQLVRRPVFYEFNVLHRNSLAAWKWVSDVFAGFLILITITGVILLKGRYGFFRRGWWFVAGGILLPAIALLIFLS